MTERVQVLAFGARTAVGLRAESSAAAARAGIIRLREHPFLVDSMGEPVVLGLDESLDPSLFGVGRMVELAKGALGEIAEKIARPTPGVPLLVGLPEKRPGWGEEDGRRFCEELSASFPPWHVQPLFHGHAAALEGIRQAVEKIRTGEWPLCIVGGVESYLEPRTLSWLEENRQLIAAGVRSGFHPGEAAGFVVLASAEASRTLAVPTSAEIRRAESARETKLIKSDAVNLGEGLAAAISTTTAELRLPEEAIDSVYCDINGERFRSEEWGFAVLRVPHPFKDPAGYRAPANCWGDVGAATGALLVMLACWRGGAGRRGLVWASSEGGLRSAVLLEQRSTR